MKKVFFVISALSIAAVFMLIFLDNRLFKKEITITSSRQKASKELKNIIDSNAKNSNESKEVKEKALSIEENENSEDKETLKENINDFFRKKDLNKEYFTVIDFLEAEDKGSILTLSSLKELGFTKEEIEDLTETIEINLSELSLAAQMRDLDSMSFEDLENLNTTTIHLEAILNHETKNSILSHLNNEPKTPVAPLIKPTAVLEPEMINDEEPEPSQEISPEEAL